MAQTINADDGSVSGSAGLKSSSDGTAVLELQTKGTTAVSVSASQVVTVNGLVIGKGGGAVSTNTALGVSALGANEAGGTNNTAVGYQALDANTTGDANTAIGDSALGANTTASNNTAIGYQAGYTQNSGSAGPNTYVGYQAGYLGTGPTNTTGIGYQALSSMSGTPDGNTAVGGFALKDTTTGGYNTVIGYSAGEKITTGTKNTIVGRYNGNQGGLDIRTSSNNIVLSDGDGNVRGRWDSAGNCFLTMGTGAGTNTVKINSSTREVTYDTSSARYKDNIRDSKYGLADVMKLRSTMFEYKKEKRTDVGFIAEEFVNVIPELVATDGEGLPDAVSYDRMVSVLVKAVQEQQDMIDELKAKVAALESK